ncbi:MAG: serine/threonine-protein phosphatase [Candidatus Aminicenantes bacterium]|nr:serine/threonine-protein phosphatase [Candidatus Aminicenantes bacterium]
MIIDAFGLSDVGRVREANEDNFLLWKLPSSGPAADTLLLAVADGIGGHAGGAVASGLAVATLKEDMMAWASSTPRPAIQAALGAVVQRANRLIFEKAAAESLLLGMGTTLVAAVLEEGRATIVNVGDSRAYHFRKGRMSQVTRDHSWVAEQRRRNLLSEQEIQNSPFKSMITRSLGFQEAVEPDFYGLELEEDDYLLFCSDGLYGPLSEKKLVKAFKHHRKAKDICPVLVQTAKELRGDDNITAVVAGLRDGHPDQKISLSDTVRLDAWPKEKT